MQDAPYCSVYPTSVKGGAAIPFFSELCSVGVEQVALNVWNAAASWEATSACSKRFGKLGRVLRALVFLGGIMLTSRALGEIKQVVSLEGITEYSLPNGMRVLLFPDASRSTVTVNLTVFVGSRHEGYGETGMAHLLEHMLFKGTPTHAEIPKLLQGRGAVFNGTTWVDRTNYFETLPDKDDNLEFALRLEADRMINSRVDRNDLMKEMSVVRSEFERGENMPFRVLRQRLVSAAYEWHNYGKSTIGNRSDIERVPIENLQAFYRKYYQPDNAMLILAGKFDSQRALELIDKYFGAIPKPSRELPNTYTEEPPQDGERQVTLRRVGDVAIAGIGYHIPAGSHADFAPLQVLDEILTGSPAGRLYKSLVETQKAASVAGMCLALHDPGLYELYAEVRNAETLENVLTEMLEIAEGAGASDIAEKDVERAKQRILSARENMATDSTELAIDLSEWAAQGDWRLYLLHRDRVEGVTAADVKRVAAKYLRKQNRTVGRFIPTETTEKVDVPPTPELAALFKDYKGREALAAGEEFEPSPENIESRTTRTKLSTGLKVVLLPKTTRGGAVHVYYRLRYGSKDSLKSREAAMEMAADLMARATKTLTHQDIQDRLDAAGATLSSTNELGALGFFAKTKREKLTDVLQLIKLIVREPSFDEAEFKILREQALAAIEQQLTEPQAVAGVSLARKLSPYPAGNPRYVPTLQEDMERYTQLKAADLRSLYDDLVGGSDGEICVVGDFEPKEVMALLEETFAGFKAKSPVKYVNKQYFEVPASEESLETPGKPNAVYLSGQVLKMTDRHPDYPALVIGNYVLGAGALSSRLGDRIRQKEGLSYGIRSSFVADPLDERAALSINAICNPVNAPLVKSLVLEEFNKLLQGGITQEELVQAKNGFLDQRKVRRAADSTLVEVLADTAYLDRTMKYHAELEAAVAKLTVDDVNAALRKHFDPAKLTVVIALDSKFAEEEKARGAAKKAESAGSGAE